MKVPARGYDELPENQLKFPVFQTDEYCYLSGYIRDNPIELPSTRGDYRRILFVRFNFLPVSQAQKENMSMASYPPHREERCLTSQQSDHEREKTTFPPENHEC